jgi:hypothetical protein
LTAENLSKMRQSSNSSEHSIKSDASSTSSTSSSKSTTYTLKEYTSILSGQKVNHLWFRIRDATLVLDIQPDVLRPQDHVDNQWLRESKVRPGTPLFRVRGKPHLQIGSLDVWSKTKGKVLSRLPGWTIRVTAWMRKVVRTIVNTLLQNGVLNNSAMFFHDLPKQIALAVAQSLRRSDKRKMTRGYQQRDRPLMSVHDLRLWLTDKFMNIGAQVVANSRHEAN